MKNEFTLAFNEVIEEKQLGREVILKARNQLWCRRIAAL